MAILSVGFGICWAYLSVIASPEELKVPPNFDAPID